MAYNVKFLKGTADAYSKLVSKDENIFYYTTDDNNLYLGEIKLSNAGDIASAIARIAKNENDIKAINTQITTITGTGEGSIQKAVADAKALLEAKMGSLDSLETTAKTNLVEAINEVKTLTEAGGEEGKVTLEKAAGTGNAAQTYTLKQGKVVVGTIDIPKDMVVESGTVATNPAGQPQGTYLVLTLANATSDKIYINVGKLVDIYTAKQNATKVQLTIDSLTREISADIKAGSIASTDLATNSVITTKIADKNVTLAKLADSVQASLTKADGAVQSVTTGTTNGNITVDGVQVPVRGLGSAAYVATTAFDPAGSARTAETNAKAYTDTALTWGTF